MRKRIIFAINSVVVLFALSVCYLLGIGLATSSREDGFSKRWNTYYSQRQRCAALMFANVSSYYAETKNLKPNKWPEFHSHPCHADLDRKEAQLKADEAKKPWYQRQTEWINAKMKEKPKPLEFDWESPDYQLR